MGHTIYACEKKDQLWRRHRHPSIHPCSVCYHCLSEIWTACRCYYCDRWQLPVPLKRWPTWWGALFRLEQVNCHFHNPECALTIAGDGSFKKASSFSVGGTHEKRWFACCSYKEQGYALLRPRSIVWTSGETSHRYWPLHPAKEEGWSHSCLPSAVQWTSLDMPANSYFQRSVCEFLGSCPTDTNAQMNPSTLIVQI